MEYSEDDFLPLSGIQHFSFCRRQWALIHIEQQWNENYLTADGRAKSQSFVKITVFVFKTPFSSVRLILPSL